MIKHKLGFGWRSVWVGLAGVVGSGGAASWEPLAQDHVVIYESPDPDNLYAYSPGLCLAPNGDLVATIDLGGPAGKDLAGPLYTYTRTGRTGSWQGRAYISSDGGESWDMTGQFPWMHERPFVAGESIYILG